METPRTAATPSEIADAEAQLGFQLSPRLTELLIEVANGGFGPSFGFHPVPSRTIVGTDLVKEFRGMQRRDAGWPSRLIPVVYCGCDVHFCIDCDSTEFRVIVFDDALGGLDESDSDLPRRLWPYPDQPFGICFRLRAKSFDEFLEMWLEDESQLYRWE